MPKRPNLICITFPEKYRLQIAEIIQDKGLSTAEILRRGFDLYYSEWAKNHFGYGKGDMAKLRFEKQNRKQARDRLISKLSALSDEELTQELIKIGFTNPSKITFKYFSATEIDYIDYFGVIQTDPETKERAYWRLQVDKDGKTSFSSRIYSWDEVVKQLIKENLI